jgi:hypothetical protein
VKAANARKRRGVKLGRKAKLTLEHYVTLNLMIDPVSLAISTLSLAVRR